MHDLWPYILLGLLGAYHGLNPAMGWLFAVALGMQERSRRAVLRSLVPIAIGHELSIVLVAVLVVGLGLLGDTQALHLGAGVALIAFGVFRFVRPHAHFRWTKLQVNRRELGWWSFLMSTAHGAGLMVAPVIIGAGSTGTAAAATDEDVHHVHLAIDNPLRRRPRAVPAPGLDARRDGDRRGRRLREARREDPPPGVGEHGVAVVRHVCAGGDSDNSFQTLSASTSRVRARTHRPVRPRGSRPR